MRGEESKAKPAPDGNSSGGAANVPQDNGPQGKERETLISTERIYEGRVVKLRIDTLRLANGKTTRREVVEHPGAVALVARDTDGKVLLVRQYRRPTGGVLLEIPAGTRELGEAPEATAARELIEETGYRAGKITRLCGIYSAPGFCEEFLDIYLAEELTPDSAEADEDEDIELVRLSLEECVDLIRRGEIKDAKSVSGLLAVLTGFGKSDR